MATIRKNTNLGNQYGRQDERSGHTEGQEKMTEQPERSKSNASLDSERANDQLNRGNKLSGNGNKSPEKWAYDESEYEDE